MKPLLSLACMCVWLAGCSGALPPTTAAGPTAAANPGAVQGPLAVTANPPNVPVTSGTATEPAGWRTFASAQLGVALDYPEAWNVSEQTGGITFTSPGGQAVQLRAVQQAADSAATPSGQQCALLITSRGLKANACYDSSTQLYSAHLNAVSGMPQELVLSTTGKQALDVYKQMLDSLRPIQ